MYHGASHLDDLSAVQAQLLVVVQHRVHVLNPDSVHGAVKDDPLALWGGVSGTLPKDLGQDPILPFMTHRVKLAIQLTHGDAFGVHDMELNPVTESPGLTAAARAWWGRDYKSYARCCQPACDAV